METIHPDEQQLRHRATTAIVPLSVELRDKTRAAHDRLESGGLHDAIFRGDASLGDWAALARSWWEVFRAIETIVGDTPNDLPIVGDLWADEMRRAPAFAHDLARLPSSRRAAEASSSAARLFGEWAVHAPARLAGALYVLEGSRLGGTVIRRRAQAVLPLSDDQITALEPGAVAARKWRAFRERLDAVALDEAEKEEAVRGAIETFELVGRMLGELDARRVAARREANHARPNRSTSATVTP